MLTNLHSAVIMRLVFFELSLCLVFAAAISGTVTAAGGVFTLSIQEESSGEPTISRVQIYRADAPNKKIPIRLTVPDGIGVVIDRNLELTLPETTYRFRLVRGPEYRIISGKFTMERTSLDAKTIELPRMAHMLANGWTSGDCCAPALTASLPLRMAAEDLHVAGVLGQVEAKPIPRRDANEPIEHDPLWVRADVVHHQGLAIYAATALPRKNQLASEWIAAQSSSADTKIAIENPFAWPLPVWLASARIDGYFLLGDWLRLDRSINKVRDGRPPVGRRMGSGHEVGRWAETIYRNLLEAGFSIAPLAGSGNDSGNTPIGYNRLYVADEAGEATGKATAVLGAEQWWQAAWSGHSVATNGPMIRPTLEGKLPGYTFSATAGEVLELHPELTLSVRDPVDYLDVVHNGQVHYSARLDEFAKAGGQIPPLRVRDSGWVMIRVVTLHEDHYRAALSAPWYIEFDGRRRVTAEGVQFFQTWLTEYEQRLKRLPKSKLQPHVPYVRAARGFWKQRADQASRRP